MSILLINEHNHISKLISFFEVLGGGILQIDHAEKTIKTYGNSGSFGPPKIPLVEKVLRHSFPDWKLTVTVTDYIRG